MDNHDPSEARTGWLFNLPLALMVLAFILVPVCGTLLTSFHREVTYLPGKWIGLQNYARLFGDPAFWQSARFTTIFLVVSVGLELGLGLIFALLLNQPLRGRGFLRVAVLVPWAVPVAVSARVWQNIYNYDYGLFNFLVRAFADKPVNWLGSGAGAFAALVVSDVWKSTPFVSIILLAGFAAIPQELYRQAMIDGTHFLQRFRYITLPLLRPVLVVALLFRTIDAIRVFDLIYVLTGGGPGGATTSVSLYAFQYYVAGDFGYGSAVSLVLFLLAGLLAAGYLRAGRFGEVLQ